MTLTQNEIDQAMREGWLVFNDCDIQRIDDPDIGRDGYNEPKFDCDEAARVFVKHWADRNSPLHVKALAMCDYEGPVSAIIP